ncbi:MAG: replication initiation factor domain-containing protein [Eubacteriales bacterium]|nr:replication initiation factor domain-containing protein [Eubacteriales bacterium]
MYHTDVFTTGLSVSVDWLAFTVLYDSYTVSDVISFLGFDSSQFSLMPRGAMGYKSMQNLDGYGLSVLSDGNTDMGIHVNITGSAVGHVLQMYAKKHMDVEPFGGREVFGVDDFAQTVLTKFLSDVCRLGQISRLDLAIDDAGEKVHFTLDDVTMHLSEGRVVSKFRQYTNNVSRKINDGTMTGGTIYFGSGQSDVRLRVYDKQLEHNTKHPEEPVSHPWVRWEFQLRNSRAQAAVRYLLEGLSLGEAAAAILNNYIRFIELDDSNRSRCSTTADWDNFVGCVGRLSLTVKAVPKTLDDKRNWIKEQVLPTLTGIIIADSGMFDIITENWDASVMRMKSDLVALVDAALKTGPTS